MTISDAINRLNNFKLYDKGNYEYGFGANKTPTEVIKEGAFGGTQFRDVYSGPNGKLYKKTWKEFDELKSIDENYYCSICYDVNANKYKVKCGTSSRFWENMNELMLQILMGGFNSILDIFQVENPQMIKGKLLGRKKL